MSDYTVLKSSREELLRKAGYAEPHALFKPAVDSRPQTSEGEREQNRALYSAND
jgi:hypothetical protein